MERVGGMDGVCIFFFSLHVNSLCLAFDSEMKDLSRSSNSEIFLVRH